jgi:hypothetical protein
MMRKKINRRDFQKVTLTGLGAALLASCRGAIRPAPATPAASAPAPSDAATRPAVSGALAPKDSPVYRNSFEEITDPQSGGITSDNALVKISTANVKYGSGDRQHGHPGGERGAVRLPRRNGGGRQRVQKRGHGTSINSI